MHFLCPDNGVSSKVPLDTTVPFSVSVSVLVCIHPSIRACVRASRRCGGWWVELLRRGVVRYQFPFFLFFGLCFQGHWFRLGRCWVLAHIRAFCEREGPSFPPLYNHVFVPLTYSFVRFFLLFYQSSRDVSHFRLAHVLQALSSVRKRPPFYILSAVGNSSYTPTNDIFVS